MNLLAPLTDRADWLAWHREGIGGSDVAAICGLSRFSGATPMAVYLDKTGLVDDGEPSEAMRWGSLLEATIVQEFEHRTGLHVDGEQWRAVDPDRPWRRATIDGLVYPHPHVTDETDPTDSTLGLLEVKTTGDRQWDDGIPDAYQLQCQWAMGILGLERAWLAVLHRGQRLDIHQLDADPAVYATLGRIIDSWWSTHIEGGVAPDVYDVDLDTVRDAWRTRVDDNLRLDATAELVDLAERWQHSRTVAAAAQGHADELEARLRVQLGEAVAITADGIDVVTLKAQRTAARIDEKALRAAHPDLAAEFTRPAGTTRVLRATKHLTALLTERTPT